jgi:hypothetical protein
MDTDRFYTNELSLEVPLGNEIVLNGVRIKTVKGDECNGCMFLKEEIGRKICTQLDVFKFDLYLRCHHTKRSDGNNIVFKEVKA